MMKEISGYVPGIAALILAAIGQTYILIEKRRRRLRDRQRQSGN